jgi:hypothetical protein
MSEATLLNIPTGNAGLAAKLDRLRAMVLDARADPAWRDWVVGVVRHVPEKDWNGEARAVSAFVRRMRYTRDPAGVELFTEPREMARRIVQGVGAGDCDDAALLGAAMLEAVGHPTRFVVGGHQGALAGEPAWAHIWLEWHHPKAGWQALDDTAKTRAAGWRPDSHFATVLRESPTMNQLPSVVDLSTWPVELGGLSGLGRLRKLRKKLKKAAKTVGKVTGSTAITKAATKVVKRALPVAALVAPVIPGVGVAASAALTVAAAAVKKREMQKKAQRAVAAEAAWQQRAAAVPDVSMTNPPVDEYAQVTEPTMQPTAAPSVYPFTYDEMRMASQAEAEQTYSAPRYPEQAYSAPWYPEAYAYPGATEPEYAQEVYGLGWFDSLVSTFTGAAKAVAPYASAAVPALTQAAQAGAFGRRGARVAQRATRALARPGVRAAIDAGRAASQVYASRPTAPRTAPRTAPSARAASSGGGAGWLLLAIPALLLLKRGRR